MAFAIGGIPEWLVDGKTGALAPLPATANGLADALVRCRKSDTAYETLRGGAREAQGPFTSSATADELRCVLPRTTTTPPHVPRVQHPLPATKTTVRTARPA